MLEPMVKQPVVIETKAGAAGAGRRAGRRQRQAGRLHAAARTSPRSPALPRSTGCSAGSRSSPTPDFIPLARFVADPCVLIVNDQQPYKTLKEFVDDAKKRPNEIIFSSSGLYGALHIPTALFMKAAGDQAAPSADQRRRTGTDRACSATTRRCWSRRFRPACRRSRPARRARSPCSAAQRSKALPDVPTMKELGYDVEYYLWVGMFAPKGTPDATSSPICATVLSKAAQQPTSSRPRSPISGRSSAYHGSAGIRDVLGRRCQAHRSGDPRRSARSRLKPDRATNCNHLRGIARLTPLPAARARGSKDSA